MWFILSTFRQCLFFNVVNFWRHQDESNFVCLCEEKLFLHFLFLVKRIHCSFAIQSKRGAQLESEGEGVRGNRAGPLLFSQNLRNTVEKLRNTEAKMPLLFSETWEIQLRNWEIQKQKCHYFSLKTWEICTIKKLRNTVDKFRNTVVKQHTNKFGLQNVQSALFGVCTLIFSAMSFHFETSANKTCSKRTAKVENRFSSHSQTI